MAGFIEQLSGPAAAGLDPDGVVILPIGAIEQHGPHLPLSVDRVIADAMANAVAELLPESCDAWFLPTLPYSKSNEHAWSPLTAWLSESTMSAVLDDLARTVAAAGIRRLAFLNGHGGNSTLLMTAARELRLKYGLLTFVLHAFPPPAYMPTDDAEDSPVDEHGMGIHGGHDETSVMLHLDPDSVDMSKAVANVPDWLLDNTHVRFGGSVPFGWLSNDFGTDGHIGDPTAANAIHGKRLFEQGAATIAAQIHEILEFDFPPPAAAVPSVIAPPGLAPPAANYAHARLTTNATRWLHTSGVVPIDTDGTVPASIAEQAQVVWRSISAMLAEAQMTPADVVSVTTWVTPGHDLGPVMAERDRALGGALASSTLLVVPELARPEWLMEIAIVAARGS